MAGKGAAKRHKQIAKKRGATTPRRMDIKLLTVKDCLQTFEALIKAYSENKIKRQKFTGLVYGLNSYSAFLRLSIEVEILKRLDAIEARLQERLTDGN